MSRIIVTDGDERAALAIVRSLGRRGEEVVVSSPRGASLAGASRYAVREERVDGFPADPDAYVASLAELARTWEAELLVPVSEASLRAVLPARNRFAPTRIPFPPADVFATASDKHETIRVAERLGIPVPEQVIVPLSRRFSGILPEGPRPDFPLVVKPSRSVVPTRNGPEKRTVTHVSDAPELRRAIRSYPPGAFPLLVQQRIEGPGVGIFLLLWDGQPRAVFSHRRIREKPPTGGVSVCRESTAVDPTLLVTAVRLLRELGWQGVAMVEFKVDRATGIPYLMEVNGRFWGSLQLAIDAEVDFPGLLLDCVRDRHPGGVVTGNGYVRSRWLWGEVDHLIARLRNGSGGRPARLRSALELLRWNRGDRLEVLRWSDHRPFLRESAEWFRAATRRAR